MPEYQVLIAGAGPTGLVMANILGSFGIATLLVEANASTVSEPRAVSIDDESLRTMQYLGLIDKVRAQIVPGYGSYYHSAAGACFARVLPDIMDYGFPRRSAFRQPLLEAQLREGLGRFPCVHTRFRTRVTHLRDAGDSVSIDLRSDEGVLETVRARYVAACDGARSGIREALKIPMGGSTYEQRWLIVDLAGSTDRFRHTRVYCDPARPALALPGPHGTRRYEFMLQPGESPEDLLVESRVRSLMARHSAEDAGLEITRKVVYQFHARIAARWRAGNIFLAGDAAHLTPPFAGQGMNSGVRDAHNLAWKLALALRGELGEGVLDTYESERKPHAWSLIQMAVTMGRVMMPVSAIYAFATQWGLRALSLYPPARDYVMQMKYKPKPRFDDGLIVHGVGAQLCGRMFPQPMVETEDSRLVPLDEMLGGGFSMVELEEPGVVPQALGAARLPVRRVRVIGRDERFVADAAVLAGAVRVRDASGALERALRASGVRAVVLRPDRYVAAGIALAAGPQEADRALEAIVRLSERKPAVAGPPAAAELVVTPWQGGRS